MEVEVLPSDASAVSDLEELPSDAEVVREDGLDSSQERPCCKSGCLGAIEESPAFARECWSCTRHWTLPLGTRRQLSSSTP